MQQKPGAQEADDRTGTRGAGPDANGLVALVFGKAVVNTDKVAGMINAAPMPATARATMIWTGLSRNTGAIDANAKIAKPTSRAPRRPYRSPIAPAGSSRHASTSV